VIFEMLGISWQIMQGRVFAVDFFGVDDEGM
jgi:hypothetical protein